MLTPERIAEMMRDTWGCASSAPRHALEFARAIEAEARRDALEEAAKVCESMHEEDRPGDYAYAIRKLKEDTQ